MNDAITELSRDAPRDVRFPPIKGIYLFVYIDVCPIVSDQFDIQRRYQPAKPDLAIIEAIQRITHLPPQLQIPRPRTEPFPALYLGNYYLPRHSPYFANYLNPIANKM